MKVGGAEDLARLEAVRAETDAPLRVDANEGWTLSQARELVPALVELGVELIEQPFPADDLESFRALRELSPRPPVIVDEGCQDLGDVAAVATYADGINVKLAKSGGLREAVRMVHAARALGLRVMIGCMVESQLGVAPAAQIASLAEWVDLDGHLLLAERAVPRPAARGRVRAALPRAGTGRGAGRVSERLAIFAEGLFVGPQRQDRARRDPLRHARRGRGDRLDPGRAHGRGGGAVLRSGPFRSSPTLGEAIELGATALLIGVAPTGGKLDPAWRAVLLEAIGAGLSVEAGLHTQLSEDPELRRAATRAGVALRDLRAAPADLTVPAGPYSRPDSVRVVHSVGSDTVIGKKVVTLELDRAARERGERSVYVPTGQTGVAIAGWGIAVDHVISDYVAGAGERLVNEGAARGDLLFVEGQGGALPPGLLRRDAGAAARLRAGPAGAGAQGGRHGGAQLPRPADPTAARADRRLRERGPAGAPDAGGRRGTEHRRPGRGRRGAGGDSRGRIGNRPGRRRRRPFRPGPHP